MSQSGRFNSSITRVRPLFQALLRREPTGAEWLTKLIAAAPNASRLSAMREAPGTLKPELASKRPFRDRILGPIELEGMFEHDLAPPTAFLRYLLTHPQRLTWPTTAGARKTYGADTTRRRAALIDGPADQRATIMAEGLAELERVGAVGSERCWWAFEGFTSVDCYLETEHLILLIEGKRTEALSESTDWFPGRNQLVRNLEVAGEIAAGRACGVLLVGEEQVPELDDDCYARSLPHQSEKERAEIRARYLGQTTWRHLCAAVGVPFESLPHER